MSQILLFHNRMSTCSQKVRLALEEKGLSWTSCEVDLLGGEQKSPAYLQVNPKGVVPALQAMGETVLESTIINEFINDLPGGPSLLPDTATGRAAARQWPRRVDDGVHAACGAITFATIMRNFVPREKVAAQAEAERDSGHGDARLSLFDHGTASPVFKQSLARLVGFIDELDVALADHQFLAGQNISLADFAAIPYVLRFEQLGLSRLWEGGARPNVARWFAEVTQRPAFDQAITRWLHPPALELFRHAGTQILPALITA